MYYELVAVTLTIVYERIFEPCKVEKSSVDALQKPGAKINHKKVIMSVSNMHLHGAYEVRHQPSKLYKILCHKVF